jgi:hypothetical protein
VFKQIIATSLRQRLLVLAAALVLIGYGSYQALRLPIDVFPALDKPTVTLMTEAEGMAPEEVEQLVTFPIEAAVKGLPGVTRVRSVSGIGLSVVYVEFEWGSDLYRNRQQIAERLATVGGELPAGVTPHMGPVTSIMGEIMLVAIFAPDGLDGEAATPMAVRDFAEWVVRPRLLTIPGVSQVIPIGGEVRQAQVVPDVRMLGDLDVTLAELETAVQGFARNTSGGFLERQAQEFLIRNLARTTQLDDLRNLVVAQREGAPVLLRQVAEVRWGARVKRGDASFEGRPAVILSVQKQPQADTLTLTREVERALETLWETLPAGTLDHEVLFRQADFIAASVGNVQEALRDAAIIVAVVLLLFLLNLRTTFISLVALPVSLLVTALVFHWMGLSVNTMTWAGWPSPSASWSTTPWSGSRTCCGACANGGRRRRGRGPHRPVGYGHTRHAQGRRRCHHRGALGDPLLDPDHRPGLRAAVRPARHRGTAVRALGHRLYRRDPRQHAGLHHPDPGALLLAAAARTADGSRRRGAGARAQGADRRLLGWSFRHSRLLLGTRAAGGRDRRRLGALLSTDLSARPSTRAP